jgi:AraC-like DNA-binding protein
MGDVDLAFLHCNYRRRNNGRTDKVFDGYCSLQLMTSGGVELWYGARQWILEGEWFWPGFPGPHIRFHAAPGHPFWTHRYVAFSGARIAHWQEEGLFPTEPQPAPPGRDYAASFDELLIYARRTDRWGLLKGINLLEKLLLELAEARSQPPVPLQKPWVQVVLDRVSENAEFPPDYLQIAQDCSMALSTLRRKFRLATGTPLHTYALQCRIAAARHLLGETDDPIKRIAERLGYRDVYFFSRQFRALTGVPPAAYRRSRQH